MWISVNLGKDQVNYRLIYELFDHRVSQRIWERFQEQEFKLLSHDRFYGFGETQEDVQQQLKLDIENLKRLKPDLYLPEDDLNYLHENFVQVHRSLSPHEEEARYWLSKFNYDIHHLENFAGGITCRFITTTEDDGEPLQESDYDLFNKDILKNHLYMNYPHVGKELMGIFKNHDIDIPSEQIMPTSVIKNDLYGWFNDNVFWSDQNEILLNRFLARIHNKLPYALDDKRLALGKIPLGKLCHEPDINIIAQNKYIHSIVALSYNPISEYKLGPTDLS